VYSVIKDWFVKQTNSSDQLILLHVIQPFGGGNSFFPKLSTDKIILEYEQESTSYAQKILTYFGRMCHQNNIDFTLLRARGSKASAKIIDCVNHFEIDHVVLGQGKNSSSSFKSWLVGSTCRDCLDSIPHSNIIIVKHPCETEMTDDRLKSIIHEEVILAGTMDVITEEHPFAKYRFWDKGYDEEELQKGVLMKTYDSQSESDLKSDQIPIESDSKPKMPDSDRFEDISDTEGSKPKISDGEPLKDSKPRSSEELPHNLHESQVVSNV